MNFIPKGREPRQLHVWRLQNKETPQNLYYKNIPAIALAELRKSLLAEQGYLCAYTMLRISSPRNGHVEHVWAQSLKQSLQISYRNMVYCHPGDGAPRCAYGAHCKDDAAVSPDTFVSPLEANCETRFTYSDIGGVAATSFRDTAAKDTIELLKLDHAFLVQGRRGAIRRLPIFDRSKSPVSAVEARKLATRLLVRDGEGKLPEYAAALAQVVSRYANRRAAKEAAMRAR